MKQGRYIGLVLSLLSAFLLLEACHPSDVKVLSKQQLSQVMADVYLTESMLKQLDSQTKREWSKGMRNDYFQDVSYHWILDKHQISEEDFYASVSRYSRHPKDMIDVLDMAEEHLKVMRHEVAEREQREIAAKEKAAFDRKWQTVHIDSSFVELWAAALYRQVDSLALNDSLTLNDSLPQTDSLLCAVDTLYAVDTASLILPYDSLLFVADSLRHTYDEQFYQYWQEDNERNAQILEATRYNMVALIPEVSADTTALETDTSLIKADSLPVKKARLLKDLMKEDLKMEIESTPELLREVPTEFRAGDGRSR